MIEKGESEEHRNIKLSLVEKFKDKGWKIRHIDGEEEQTDVIDNNGKIGDGENKRPDIDAKDSKDERTIRGEVKIGNGDFDSDHSITQYKLFSNRISGNINSWLIIGVPTGMKRDMEKVLVDNFSAESIEKYIAVWECESI